MGLVSFLQTDLRAAFRAHRVNTRVITPVSNAVPGLHLLEEHLGVVHVPLERMCKIPLVWIVSMERLPLRAQRPVRIADQDVMIMGQIFAKNVLQGIFNPMLDRQAASRALPADSAMGQATSVMSAMLERFLR